MALSFSFFLG